VGQDVLVTRKKLEAERKKACATADIFVLATNKRVGSKCDVFNKKGVKFGCVTSENFADYYGPFAPFWQAEEMGEGDEQRDTVEETSPNNTILRSRNLSPTWSVQFASLPRTYPIHQRASPSAKSLIRQSQNKFLIRAARMLLK